MSVQRSAHHAGRPQLSSISITAERPNPNKATPVGLRVAASSFLENPTPRRTGTAVRCATGLLLFVFLLKLRRVAVTESRPALFSPNPVMVRYEFPFRSIFYANFFYLDRNSESRAFPLHLCFAFTVSISEFMGVLLLVRGPRSVCPWWIKISKCL
jgi:hypothetical protein